MSIGQTKRCRLGYLVYISDQTCSLSGSIHYFDFACKFSLSVGDTAKNMKNIYTNISRLDPENIAGAWTLDSLAMRHDEVELRLHTL